MIVTEDNSLKRIHKALADLKARGLAVCRIEPGGKSPRYRLWPAASLDDSDLYGPADGIGILTGWISDCGKPDHAVVGIDLDAMAAIQRADEFLPQTGMIEGRATKPRSHRYFLVPVATIPDRDIARSGQSVEAAARAGRHPGPAKRAYRANGKLLLEVLGSGQQVVAPPTLHPSGEQREWEGELREPAVVAWPDLIAAVERLAAACGWAPEPEDEWKEEPCKRMAKPWMPGNIFSEQTAWDEILEPHGWSYCHGGKPSYWVRPGKSPRDGHSASIGHGDHDNFYVFSSDAAPFEAGRSYTKFAAYSVLNHNGDFTAATEALFDRQCRARGWHEPPKPGSNASAIRARAGRVEGQKAAEEPKPAEEQKAAEPAPRRRWLRVADLRKLPPVRFLVKRHFATNSFCCIYGPSGAGKSFAAIDMALAIASGRPYLGIYDVQQGPVAYISGEGNAAIVRRFDAWSQHHGVEIPDDLFIYPGQVDLRDDAAVEDLLGTIEAEVGRPVAIFGDTVARLFGPGDENSTQDMAAFVRGVDRLREATGAAFVGIHHTGKDPGRGERGNSALRAASDTMIGVEETNHGRGSLISCSKQKDYDPFDSYIVRRKVVHLGQDQDGEDLTSCVLTLQDAEHTTFQLLPSKTKQGLLKLWDVVGANGFTNSEAATAMGVSRSTVSETFRGWTNKGLLQPREGRHVIAAPIRQCLIDLAAIRGG